MNRTTKRVTTLGVLCALAYTAAAAGRIPLVLFLKYDPKDILLVIGGFLYGPLASCSAALIVSLAEMFTISETGILGFLMNVLSSCSFAGTAAWIYKWTRTFPGAVTGLLCGWACMVSVMLFWNVFVVPVYMGYPREAVMELLISAFLPFNLLKGGLNAAVSLLLYKPVVTVLRRAHLREPD